MKYMNNKGYTIFMIIVSVLASISTMSLAEYYHAHNEKRFEYILDKYDMVVVLFYNSSLAYECVKQFFKQLSRGYSYDQADVAFVSMDILDNGNAQMAQAYGVRRTPALLLFEDGYVVIGKDRVPVVATDVRSISDIRLFINTYFGDRIEDVLREKEEMHRERRYRGRKSNFHFGISFGYPYYPYYGYPFGYSYGYPIYMGW